MNLDFEKLCLRHYKDLVDFATYRTNNRAAAKDIVQDAMIRAWKAWDKFVPQGDPEVYARSWMFRIVANTFINQYQKDLTASRTVENSRKQSVEDMYHSFEMTEEFGDEVREALDRINPEWAQVVKMVYVDEIPAHEVARILDLAPGTVRSRMARGRLALARILEPIARQRFGLTFGPSGSIVGSDASLDPAE